MTDPSVGGRAPADAPSFDSWPAAPGAVDTPAWVRDAVFYQIFPDRFRRSGRVHAPGPLEPWDAPPTSHGFKGGDLYGIAERVPELAELGVTALYLTPIFASASNHRYHTYDYLSVDPLLGGDAALRELLDTAHGNGMRVVLDGVFNHASRGFWAFQHVAENGRQSPYRGWFYLDQAVLRGERGLQPYPDAETTREIQAAEETEGRSGAASERILGYRAWWDLPALPKLNVSDPEMRAYLLGVAEHWLRFGIDGWRLDVPAEIDDDEFWREFRGRVRAVRPDAYIVGEIWREAPKYLQGDMFDALMNYPLAEALIGFTAGSHLDLAVAAEQHEYREFIRSLDAAAFAERLEHQLAAYDPAVVAVQLNLLGSHDTPRFLTVAGGDRDALRLATLIQMTLPGAPCIYYGDEIGLEGHHDPDDRRPYPTDPTSRDDGLRASIRGAIALRRANPALRGQGRLRVLSSDGLVHVHGRFIDGEAFVVAINAGDDPASVRFTVRELAARRLVPQAWEGNAWGALGETLVGPEGAVQFDLPARSGVVLRAEA